MRVIRFIRVSRVIRVLVVDRVHPRIDAGRRPVITAIYCEDY